jgi:deoxyxylulose-5-phosphate synthase
MGIPDNYVEHGTRSELLDSLSLNAQGIVQLINEMKGEA